MKGLIKEMETTLNEEQDSVLRDAEMIAAAQKIEHYEMAGYGVAKTFAKQLEYDEAADLLDATLKEEGNANKKLTSIAEGGIFTSGINEEAEQE